MQNETHIGAVNAHPERVGRNDKRQIAREKFVLHRVTRVIVHARVIKRARNFAHLAHKFRNFFRLAPRARVNNSAARRVRQKIARQTHFGFYIGRVQNFQIQIWAIESGDEARSLRHFEHFENVVLHANCRRRGERERNGRFEFAPRVRELQIVGTKIVTPLRQTMRFVNRQHAERNLLQCAAEICTAKTFGRDQNNFVLSLRERGKAFVLFGGGQCGIDVRRRDAALFQRIGLVFHQRDERRNHQRGPVAQ